MLYIIYINVFPLPFCYNFTPLPLAPELTKVTRSYVPCLSHAGHVVNPFTVRHVPLPSRVPLPAPGAVASEFSSHTTADKAEPL